MQPFADPLKRDFSNFFINLLGCSKSVIFALLESFCFAHKKEFADV